MLPADIAKLHNGLYQCPLGVAANLMPELSPIFEECPVWHGARDNHTVDVKVHMLMPGQWPCVPNWHYDFIPRGADGKQDWSRVDYAHPPMMWMWLSGPPLTEFRSERGEVIAVPPQVWRPFTQLDEHRGVASTEFTWRIFIRVAPTELLKPAPQIAWLRRHSQVYLDAEEFKW